MSDITEEEQQKITEFRGRVGELLKDEYTKSDLYLIRWLRARELNLDAAEAMIRNHYKWRDEKRIDTLLAETPDNYMLKNYKYWMNGTDVKGRPVLCIAMGDWDVRKVVDDDRVEEFVDYMNRMYERVVECIVNANKRRKPEEEPVTQFTCIVDWDKFTGRQTASIKAMQTMLNAAMVYEAHYPGKKKTTMKSFKVHDSRLAFISADPASNQACMVFHLQESQQPTCKKRLCWKKRNISDLKNKIEILGKAFFVNINPFFQIFFNLLKTKLAPRTLSKIECYGYSRQEWEPIVRATVEEHQIPRQFGG